MEKQITLINGNSSEELKKYPDNYFDSIVTDPPYGIEFLGKDWDKNTGPIEVWTECLRVLKPGGHLLSFSAARTYHRLATNLEDVGFEIRDQLMWLYGSGFPKGQDMGKIIEKREGKRKHSMEYKPMLNQKGELGTGGYTCSTCGKKNHILGVGFKCNTPDCSIRELIKPADNEYSGWKTGLKPAHEPIVMARKPFKGSTIDNVLKYGTGAINVGDTRIGDEEVKSWIKADSPHKQYNNIGGEKTNWNTLPPMTSTGRYPSNVLGEVEGYQKYFYCPKVSRKERHTGDTDNKHPTIKPVALMKWLVTLVTPKQGKVLDPFNGSGSTGMAVKEFGGQYVGIDLDPNYIEISNKRIQAWK